MVCIFQGVETGCIGNKWVKREAVPIKQLAQILAVKFPTTSSKGIDKSNVRVALFLEKNAFFFYSFFFLISTDHVHPRNTCNTANSSVIRQKSDFQNGEKQSILKCVSVGKKC